MAIKLTKEEIKEIIPSILKYFDEEMEVELCEMKAGFILEYFMKEIGPYAYNQGVKDAEKYFRERLEDLRGTCYEHGLTYWIDKSNK